MKKGNYGRFIEMKYIIQDWDKSNDGILFFVQRLQEMFFHYSDDIVRAPVHNTQTLLEEYILAERDKKIGEYHLGIISKEIEASLFSDKILRKKSRCNTLFI